MIERLTNNPMPIPRFSWCRRRRIASRDCAGQAYARIADGQTHTVAGLSFGFDQHLSRSAIYVDHRVGGIAEEIQDDLLELNPIAVDDWQILGKLRLKNDAIPQKVVRRERDDLARRLVQIQWFGRELPLAEQRPQPRNDLGGAGRRREWCAGPFRAHRRCREEWYPASGGRYPRW